MDVDIDEKPKASAPDVHGIPHPAALPVVEKNVTKKREDLVQKVSDDLHATPQEVNSLL